MSILIELAAGVLAACVWVAGVRRLTVVSVLLSLLAALVLRPRRLRRRPVLASGPARGRRAGRPSRRRRRWSSPLLVGRWLADRRRPGVGCRRRRRQRLRHRVPLPRPVLGPDGRGGPGLRRRRRRGARRGRRRCIGERPGAAGLVRDRRWRCPAIWLVAREPRRARQRRRAAAACSTGSWPGWASASCSSRWPRSPRTPACSRSPSTRWWPGWSSSWWRPCSDSRGDLAPRPLVGGRGGRPRRRGHRVLPARHPRGLPQRRRRS